MGQVSSARFWGSWKTKQVACDIVLLFLPNTRYEKYVLRDGFVCGPTDHRTKFWEGWKTLNRLRVILLYLSCHTRRRKTIYVLRDSFVCEPSDRRTSHLGSFKTLKQVACYLALLFLPYKKKQGRYACTARWFWMRANWPANQLFGGVKNSKQVACDHALFLLPYKEEEHDEGMWGQPINFWGVEDQ